MDVYIGRVAQCEAMKRTDEGQRQGIRISGRVESSDPLLLGEVSGHSGLDRLQPRFPIAQYGVDTLRNVRPRGMESDEGFDARLWHPGNSVDQVLGDSSRTSLTWQSRSFRSDQEGAVDSVVGQELIEIREVCVQQPRRHTRFLGDRPAAESTWPIAGDHAFHRREQSLLDFRNGDTSGHATQSKGFERPLAPSMNLCSN